ncbi:MAG: P27 family phage terminase small subunit [Dehalococcoidia bacterium]|nr:P27 family phage terminase small subunit [Dehalococcoidia bacterium]
MRAPSHLSPASRRWWASVVDSYELEEHHRLLLTAACQAWDHCQAARRVLATDGMTYTDRFGQPRARPEVGIERDSRIGFMRALKELGLDIVPSGPIGRPPGGGY